MPTKRPQFTWPHGAIAQHYAYPGIVRTAEHRTGTAVAHPPSATRERHPHLGPVPAARGGATFGLAALIGRRGVEAVRSAGLIRFHAVGDTGTDNDHTQRTVAREMAADFDRHVTDTNPAFLLHLGDIVYGHNKDQSYRDQFYRPYKDYPAKIIAVPGNHDGETFKRTDPTSLRAFKHHFCAETPRHSTVAGEVGIYRETMAQPGVYWALTTPFADIIGLYTNIEDDGGFLDGPRGDRRQSRWLAATLRRIGSRRTPRKALIIATHHPPFSNGRDHGGSAELLQAIDEACRAAEVLPDVVLSAHSHNYQRHTRRVKMGALSANIPYVVAGCGGNGIVSAERARGQVTGESTYERSHDQYGYLLVEATRDHVTIEFKSEAGSPAVDRVSVDLSTHQVRHE